MNFLLTFFLFTFIHYHSVNSRSNTQIFDGSGTSTSTYPWMVSIRLNFLSIVKRDCAGVILSNTFLLTAASCFQNTTGFTRFFVIKAGINENRHEPNEQTRFIAQLIFHPNYNENNYLNDLTIIRLSSPLNLDRTTVYPVVLSNLISVKYMNLTVISWTESYSGLKQVTVQENIECTLDKSIDPLKQLCASGTCLGDTGAPLMLYSNENRRYELIAVTSYRNVCTIEGLYTRIRPYIDWITSILKKPPIFSTFPPTIPTLPSTTTPAESHGPPIVFACDRNYSCGCSSVPVVFHDGYSITSRDDYDELGIVGGETAQPHSWAWIVSLRTATLGHACGASLIHNEWVLTAAHCHPSTSTIVHIGVHDQDLPAPIIREIVEVIIHPDFIPAPKFLNDIALLRISPPVDLINSYDYATLSCLPSNETGMDYPKVNTRLAVIGWGKLTYGGSQPNQLHQVRVQALANDDWRCQESNFDTDRQFCAMVDGGGKDACQGDSGGPIHQWLDDHWEQVGIVSFGVGCALADRPGIYTRLSFYSDWIQSYINPQNETTTTTWITTETITTISNITDVNTTAVANKSFVSKTKLFNYVIIFLGLRFFLFINFKN